MGNFARDVDSLIELDGQYPSTSFLGTYSGATAAFSLRDLNGSGGYVVSVRRSGDDAVKAFTAVQINNGSLAAWVSEGSGTGDGFVRAWLDQTGGNNNAVQYTNANQPKLVTSGVVETQNGKPALNLNGTSNYMTLPGTSSRGTFNAFHNGGKGFVISVMTPANAATTDTVHVLFASSHGNSNTVGVYFAVDDRPGASLSEAYRFGISTNSASAYNAFVSQNSAYAPMNAQYLTSIRMDSSNATVNQRAIGNVNGGSDINTVSFSGAGTTASNTTYDMNLFWNPSSTTYYTSGFAQELIFFTTDQSSNRTAMESAINTYYTIY
jgi:hypothetical protein